MPSVTVWQQAITWASVDPDVCHYVALPAGPNEFKLWCLQSLNLEFGHNIVSVYMANEVLQNLTVHQVMCECHYGLVLPYGSGNGLLPDSAKPWPT